MYGPGDNTAYLIVALNEPAAHIRGPKYEEVAVVLEDRYGDRCLVE
jgi:hypothetical protein